MSDSPTPLRLPATLPFPITITRILQSTGAELHRGTPLVEYAFTSDSSRKAIAAGKTKTDEAVEVKANDMVGSWECPIEGELAKWYPWVRPGQKVDKRDASRPILDVQQPCSHPVQLHGLCGICGKELTETDYLAPPADADPTAGPSGYNGGFEMSHDALGVTVSSNLTAGADVLKEAKRLDDQTKENLLRTRRLSLIVDLDQTIIHTTVDPTVGEWMAEIEEDREAEAEAESGSAQAPQGEGAEAEAGKGAEVESTTPPGTPPPEIATANTRSKREKNPNAEALKDVARFNLADDLPPGYVANGKQVKFPQRWYYTKPRPGLQPFLDRMSEMYEMHVYTMGTREYADAICKVIDPDGKIFGGRVLSRDESGSFSSKNLKRLFPTDQSMVVVIDDRSDVWADIPNLVKVVPYDFFVGIGDINGSFLPPNPAPGSTSTQLASPSSLSGFSDASTPPPISAPDSPAKDNSLTIRQKMLDDLSEKRPLKKLQEEIDTANDAEACSAQDSAAPSSSDAEGGDAKPLSSGSQEEKDGTADKPASPTHTHRKPLLKVGDDELDRVANILTEVHHSYYAAYDARDKDSRTGKLPMGCDVELIIPDLKQRVLEDCHIVFSGVVPRHLRPQNSDVWRLAEAFGAIPQENITASTTHCVTANPSTEKAYKVNKAGGKVVWTDWFWQSVAQWRRLDEGPFLAIQKPELKAASEPAEAAASADSVGEPASSGVSDSADKSAATEPTETGEIAVEADTAATGSGAAPVDDPDFEAGEWNDDDEKEWAEFMDGDGEGGSGSEGGTNDAISDAGLSTTGSIPGTPRKRVRYADEEHLPLESFREPDPSMADDPPEGRPKKRKAIMLPYRAEGDNAPTPEANRFDLSGADGRGSSKAWRMDWSTVESGDDTGPEPKSADRTSEADDQDEFARMLMDELDES